MTTTGIIIAFCCAMALASCAYQALVIFAALRFRATPEPPLDFTPPVSVFKPLHGLDRDLYALLAEFCRQDYPEYEVLFAVGDPADPATEVVRQLQRDFPNTNMRLLIADCRYGMNRKVDSLDKMYREMRYDYMVISDADMRVTPSYLRHVMAPLRDPNVGLVTCFYRGEPGGTLASTFEAVGTTGEFHGGAMVARILEGVKFAFGSTIATRKDLIEPMGGFPSIADYADDFEMGNRIARLGRDVVISPYVLSTLLPADTWTSMIQHQFRWEIGTSASRPKGHFGLILTHGLPFLLTALVLAPRSHTVWMLGAAWLALRLSAAWTAGVLVLKDPVLRRNLYLVPARDLLSFLLWGSSFFYKHITWKGQRFRVEKGKMMPVQQ